MEKFTQHKGLVIPLNRANVDTDQIIPKQFLKSIKRTGFGQNLFDVWRYLDEGYPGQDCAQRPVNESFVLNFPRYHNASIMVTQQNFGCGSSREHAPWAILEYGVRCVIAPSFADIFFNNSFKNGLLPIVLKQNIVSSIIAQTENEEGYELTVNLEEQSVSTPEGESYKFDVDPFRKHCLINGLDDIDLTLESASEIRAYEAERSARAPWIFNKLV